MFVSHFKPALNTKEDNAEFVLFTQGYYVYCVNKSDLAVFVPCV